MFATEVLRRGCEEQPPTYRHKEAVKSREFTWVNTTESDGIFCGHIVSTALSKHLISDSLPSRTLCFLSPAIYDA